MCRQHINHWPINQYWLLTIILSIAHYSPCPSSSPSTGHGRFHLTPVLCMCPQLTRVTIDIIHYTQHLSSLQLVCLLLSVFEMLLLPPPSSSHHCTYIVLVNAFHTTVLFCGHFVGTGNIFALMSQGKSHFNGQLMVGFSSKRHQIDIKTFTNTHSLVGGFFSRPFFSPVEQTTTGQTTPILC